jgi:hypothetical protein
MAEADRFPVASGVLDEAVGHGTGREGVDGLVQQVDETLVQKWQ